MDLSYATVNIMGYERHLAAQTVKLPLKYPATLQKYTPNEQFHRQLASTGDIINLSKINSSFIDQISYLVLNDMKTISFTPLNSQVNNFRLKFQSLQVVLPHELKSNHCISVYYEKLEGEDEGWIIVDVIDENYLFITLKISLTDFIVEDYQKAKWTNNFDQNNQKAKFSLNNFDQWGKISVPYSFELRSPPSFMKAIDSRNIIVSLKDGGLLHLQRSDHLKDFAVHNFSDPTSLLPLNFVSGLFKRDSSNQDIVLDGVSSNSLVDLVTVSSILITLTVDKVLKFWNLENHQQARSPIDLKDDKSGSRADAAWLSSVSSSYLQVVESEASGHTYLTCHYTTTSNSLKQNYNEMGLLFKAWEVLDHKTQIELISLDRLTFKPQLPDLLISSQGDEDTKYHNSLWFVQDFRCESRGEYLNYHILWKSNTSSILVTYKIHFNNGAVSSINWSQPNSSNSLSDSASYHDIEYYSNKVLNSESYDDLIITTSLNIFREHIGLENVRYKSSIRETVIETIDKAANDYQDRKSCWYKLDCLCEELKKVGEESLALCITNNSTILTLNINNISIFRQSHYYEGFFYYKPSSSEGKLAAILERLTVAISPKTYNKIYRGVLNLEASKVTADNATMLYDTILNNKISTDEISLIMTELESIPDVLDVISSLIDSRIKPDNHDETIRKLNSPATIGTLTKLNTLVSFRNIKRHHESILLSLVVLFLICEVNEQILLLLNKLIQRLSSYVIVDCVFNTCFESDNRHAKLESTDLSNSGNSLFWTGLANRNPRLNSLITEGKLTESYDYFYGHVISSYEKFILDVIIVLINHGEGLLIKEKFFTKLDRSKIIDRFLIGLVYLINNEPLEFFLIFEEYDFFRFDNDSIKEDLKKKFLYSLSGKPRIKTLNSLSINPHINSFLTTLFLNEFDDNELEKANYFHALSELSKSQGRDLRHRSHHRQKFITPAASTINAVTAADGSSSTIEVEFINNALKFERIAVENLKKINNPDETIIMNIDQFYLNIFEMALSSLNYDLVYECLSYLSSKVSKIFDFKDLLSRFINNLMLNQRISIIFPPNSNKLYSKHYLLIDSILLETANNELALANSLKCYEYLYTWRLFGPTLDSSQLADKRGAAESLYMFITRFKHEQKNLLANSTTVVEDIKQYKLKILELYMIILNCLKSFDDDDDKWIIKSKSVDSLSVIKLDEINLEYYEWLRELEDDLN